MNFSEALEAVKSGKKIQRSGWNGKGMFVVYQKGYPNGIPINKNTAEATGIQEGTICRFLPYLMMFTADGSFVPWLISQTDALADDWTVIEEGLPFLSTVQVLEEVADFWAGGDCPPELWEKIQQTINRAKGHA